VCIRLGEEERKAAQAARQQRDIEQKRANVGSTLSMLGIGMRGFGSMSKPLSKTGAASLAIALLGVIRNNTAMTRVVRPTAGSDV
jgi:hypothetical protein